jgi:16S rRNA C1402 (ribose-2'-O) methylase RsmI
VAAAFPDAPKGEITLVVGPPTEVPERRDSAKAAEAVIELVAAGVPRRRAAETVARLTGLPRRRLYDMSL